MELLSAVILIKNSKFDKEGSRPVAWNWADRRVKNEPRQRKKKTPESIPRETESWQTDDRSYTNMAHMKLGTRQTSSRSKDKLRARQTDCELRDGFPYTNMAPLITLTYVCLRLLEWIRSKYKRNTHLDIYVCFLCYHTANYRGHQKFFSCSTPVPKVQCPIVLS